MPDEDEREDEQPAPAPEPASEPPEPREPREPERHENEWTSLNREMVEQTRMLNQALAMQARRMDDLARLHESHTRQWEASLAEARELMKSAREAMAAADQARSELVTVTAATVRIAEVLQQTLQALQDEDSEANEAASQ